MGLIIPTRRDVVAALQSYVRSYLPELDPSTERRAYIGGQVKSLGSSLHDWYVALKRYGDNEPFPQTASRDFLLGGWWRDITKLNPNSAAPARGVVVLEGTSGTVIPAGSVFTANNASYSLDRSALIITQSFRANSLTRSGSTAIFETLEKHNLASGQTVTVSGAVETDYNGTFQITVTAEDEFTYDLGALVPATPATGSPLMTSTWASAAITATTNGQSTNIDAGGTLASNLAITGFDGTGTVTFGGIAGGTEVETTDAYRKRILEALGTDFGMFSALEIKIVAKIVPGVTRVWVREATLNATNGVAEGQVKIAFMRDIDANPFPSAQEVAAVKAMIVDNIMPAHTDAEDVIVQSPTPKVINFTFTSMLPDTASMRRAVLASLRQYFSEVVDYATDIGIDDYRCAIKDTYDREGQAYVRSFTLSTPTAAISVGLNEMPRLGTVTFPSNSPPAEEEDDDDEGIDDIDGGTP